MNYLLPVLATLPVVALVLIVVSYSPALPAEQPGKSMRATRVFSVHDTDADGYLSRKEYEMFLEYRRQRHAASGRQANRFRKPRDFDEIDANHDQHISESELTAVLGRQLRMQKRIGREHSQDIQ